MIRKLLVIFGLLYLIISFQLSAYCYQLSAINYKLSTDVSNFPFKKGGVTTVVIDAGHGGKDPGCLGHRAKEKDIALAIALALGRYIEKNCPDVKVIYTRHDDNFVELFQRAEIANRNKADLFISIHCNSSPSPSAYGVETFVMGLNKSQANLNVAKKENSSILLEDNYKKNYGGFDPNSPEAYIIFSLYQNAYLDQSLNLASKIEKQIGKAGRFGRGVKQAGFLVIYKTTMPGMLVEAGFLSNESEEEFLMSDVGKNTIAFSIFKAFREYKNEREGRKQKIENGELFAKQTISKELMSSQARLRNDSVNNDTNSPNHQLTKLPNHQITKSVDSQITKLPNHQIIKSQDSQLTNSQTNQITDSLTHKITKSPAVIYKVQFATSPVKKDINTNAFKTLDRDMIGFYLDNGIFKYTVGNEKELADAKKILVRVKEKGFQDAFIIAFYNGKRVKSITEALNLQKNRN
jgi:N-acetylmuramoyl-L-alanine amidase